MCSFLNVSRVSFGRANSSFLHCINCCIQYVCMCEHMYVNIILNTSSSYRILLEYLLLSIKEMLLETLSRLSNNTHTQAVTHTRTHEPGLCHTPLHTAPQRLVMRHSLCQGHAAIDKASRSHNMRMSSVPLATARDCSSIPLPPHVLPKLVAVAADAECAFCCSCSCCRRSCPKAEAITSNKLSRVQLAKTARRLY